MTLEQLWPLRTNITYVAKRVGKPSIYIACGHNSWQLALENARGKQEITAQDELADDWYETDAP